MEDGGGGYGEKKKIRDVGILLILTTFMDAKVNMVGPCKMVSHALKYFIYLEIRPSEVGLW